MMFSRSSLIVVVGACVAVLLQIVLAPSIALFGSFPNIPLVYVMAVAVVRNDHVSLVMPFVLGLVCDLLGSDPVGASACVFLLGAVVVARIFQVMNNDTLFMPFVIMFIALLVAETLYEIILLICGYPTTFFAGFFQRAAPCALYDCVACVCVYPILVVLFAQASDVPTIRMPKLR